MEDIAALGGRIATFEIGDSAPACINISVFDDECFEGDHSFIVMLINPSPSSIVIDQSMNVVTVTIDDTDGNNIILCKIILLYTMFCV